MLSFRLNKIKNLIDPSSTVVWDVCCDHGLLGESLINSRDKVYFIDVVSGIIEDLRHKLSVKNFVGEYECLTLDGSDIPISNTINETVVIAGVGGHTCIKIMESLLLKYGKLNVKLIISPQKNLDKVINFLMDSNFLVISHDIIFDKAQKYDILKIEHISGDSQCN